MKPTLTLIIVLLFTLTSCKHSNNGDYLVIKDASNTTQFRAISPFYYHNDEVTGKLKSALVGKKFNIEFVDDYVTLKCFNSKAYTDIVLTKSNGEFDIEYYKAERIINDVSFQFSLMANDTDYLLLAVDCTVKDADKSIIPVQLGGAIRSNPIQGRTILQLNKIQ